MNSETEEVEIKIPSDNHDAYRIVNRLHGQAEIVETKYLSKHIKLKIRGSKAKLQRY
jgi:hypothetical protein